MWGDSRSRHFEILSTTLSVAVQLAFLVSVATLVYVVFLREQTPRSVEMEVTPAGTPAPIETDVRIAISNVHFKGSSSARIIVGEFADVDCPYCVRWASAGRMDFEKRFVETGKVQFAFFQLPLPNHPGAELAAAAMECAGVQGAFWPMHDRLFQPNRPRDTDGLVTASETLSLNSDAFRQCLSNWPPKVREDQVLAGELGISGTPTFIVATLDEVGTMSPRFKIVGAPNERKLEELIQQILRN